MTVTLTYYSDDKCTTKFDNPGKIPETYVIQNFENNVCTADIFLKRTVGWAKYNCTTGDFSMGNTETGCKTPGPSDTGVVKKDTCNAVVDDDPSYGYAKFECSSEPDLTGGDITGIVVGSVAGLILLGYIYYRYYRKGKSIKFTKSKKGNKK